MSYNIETSFGNGLTGTPLTQLMTYTLHHACSEQIDCEIVKCLVNKGMNLDVDVICVLDPHSTNDHMNFVSWCSVVELGIMNKRIDVAKLLVISGANPIHPSLEHISGVVQLLEEYYDFGTNDYMRWLVHEHLLSHELHDFIETVVNLDVFNESGIWMFNEVGRHPAHAVLTCGHEELARRFLVRHGSDMLYVKDVTERTALQISAQRGDLESVRTLLKL